MTRGRDFPGSWYYKPSGGRKAVAEFKTRIQSFWKMNYGLCIDPRWHMAFAAVTGREDPRFISHDVWVEDILPCFNRLDFRPAYLDKNLARRLAEPEWEVPSVLKVMKGRCYSSTDQALNIEESSRILCDLGDIRLIVKSASHDDGSRVFLLGLHQGLFQFDNREMTLSMIIEEFGTELQIQQRFSQHPTLAMPHPESLNTVRVLTFRWQDSIRAICMFQRMGIDGSVTDNAGTGGLCRGISEQGLLYDYAVNNQGQKHIHHPTTAYAFKKEQLPGFKALRKIACELHLRIPHFDLISWDFAIDPQSRPFFLEMNFQGVSYVYQFATGEPLFKEDTAAVLQHIRKFRQESIGY